MLRHHCRLNASILDTYRTRVWNLTRKYQRHYATKPTDDFNYNRNEFTFEGSDAHDDEIAQYPRVTAEELASHQVPPRGVKMLVRDFIQDSLYNPNYGYFSRRAEIFSPVEPIDFNDISEAGEFDATVARLYRGYDDASDPSELTGRQVWHTPTELFKVGSEYSAQNCYLLHSSPSTATPLLNVSSQNIYSSTSRTRTWSYMSLEREMEPFLSTFWTSSSFTTPRSMNEPAITLSRSVHGWRIDRGSFCFRDIPWSRSQTRIYSPGTVTSLRRVTFLPLKLW